MGNFFAVRFSRAGKLNIGLTFLLVFFTSFIASLYAEKGDTIEKAAARYGYPAGEIKSESGTVHIYKTQFGQIRETYDSKGICTESLVTKQPLSVPPRQTVKYVYPKATPAPTATPKQTINYISAEERATRPDLQSIHETPKTTTASKSSAIQTSSQSVMPRIYTLMIVAITFGLIISATVRTISSPIHQSSTSEKIESLCCFMQRKNKKNNATPAPQDPNKDFYKNYPAA